MINTAGGPERFWKKHQDNDPYCMCRACYWGRIDQVKEGAELPSFLRPISAPLEVRVAKDIDALVAQFASDFGQEKEDEPHKNGIELPDPIYDDLTSYRDALALAYKNCIHQNIETDDPFAPSYIDCYDCGKHMSAAQFNEDRKKFFGTQRRKRDN